MTSDGRSSFRLECGSMVHKSCEPGKWFVWVLDGYRVDEDGHRVPDGHIPLTPTGILYFNTPELAEQYVKEIRASEPTVKQETQSLVSQ